MSRKQDRKKRTSKNIANKKGTVYDAGRRAASQRKFLTAHQLGVSTTQGAHIAGVSRATLYRWRDEDPEFAQAWLESRDKTMEDLEVRAYKRAIEGNDRLLMFLLKSHMPLTYNKRQQPIIPDKSQAISFADIAERLRQCP